MITVSEKALSHHCHSYGIKEADLSFLGGGREDFFQYRRLLLFTCMQNYLNHNPDLKKNFLFMIESKPEIFRNL